MQIREVDHSFLLLHLRELARLHTTCFDESDAWREHWTDYPGSGAPDSLSYLLDAAARDTTWVVAIDDGEVLEEPGRILACGILERLAAEHAAELNIDLRGKEGRVFYNCVYFHDLRSVRHGIAHAVIGERIDIARRLGGTEIWTRTRKDHEHMHRILTQFGFEPVFEEEVVEGGVASKRQSYRKALETKTVARA